MLQLIEKENYMHQGIKYLFVVSGLASLISCASFSNKHDMSAVGVNAVKNTSVLVQCNANWNPNCKFKAQLGPQFIVKDDRTSISAVSWACSNNYISGMKVMGPTEIFFSPEELKKPGGSTKSAEPGIYTARVSYSGVGGTRNPAKCKIKASATGKKE